MSENLKLPICPRCNSTDVEKVDCVMLIHQIVYQCTKCEVSWGWRYNRNNNLGSRYNSIEDEWFKEGLYE